MSKPKALWHSNAPYAPTGYGNQTGLFLEPLSEHYDIAASCFYGLEGGRLIWHGIPLLPGLGGEYGNDYLTRHAMSHFEGGPRDGTVVTLIDVWVLDPAMAAQLNMACWVPVDHEPAPPRVQLFLERSGAIPLAMSRFGEKMLKPFDPIYVPHGVDTETYRPTDREVVRKATGVPEDAFLIGMVGANKGRPSRKGFQQALEAFRLFAESNDDAILYLHTVMDPNLSGQGEDLTGIIRSLELPPDRVMVADQYRMLFDPYSPSTMANIYGAMDVLLNPSQGEGFGIPVLEAQACGIPAIVTNFSAMEEVCGAGWHVACRPVWTGQSSWQALADVPDIVEALTQCRALSKSAKKKLSEQARTHAKQYAVPRVMEKYMLPALEEVRERHADRAPEEVAEGVAA